MMRRAIWQAVLVGLAFMLGTSSTALAQSFCNTQEGQFFSLVDTPNLDLTPFASPFGEVCVTLINSTTASIVAETFDPPYTMGGHGALDLNFNGTVSLDPSGPFTGDPGSGPFSQDTGNISQFGIFNFAVDSFDGFTHSTSMLTFTVDNTSGSWASAADVLAFNANGFDAAMHIFVAGTADLCGGSNCTGFAGEGQTPFHENPEPAVLSLLGIGLLGMGLTRMRRRKT